MFRGVCLLLLLIACADYLFTGGVHFEAGRRVAASLIHFFAIN